jgi:MFS family permease
VAAPAFAMVVPSLPVGLVSDRWGARAVTIAASALLTISALGQSLAGSYAVLLASWTLFGVTSAITSGKIARLGDRLPAARRLGSRHARARRGAADPGGRQLRVTGDRALHHSVPVTLSGDPFE